MPQAGAALARLAQRQQSLAADTARQLQIFVKGAQWKDHATKVCRRRSGKDNATNAALSCARSSCVHVQRLCWDLQSVRGVGIGGGRIMAVQPGPVRDQSDSRESHHHHHHHVTQSSHSINAIGPAAERVSNARSATYIELRSMQQGLPRQAK
jgi:hypothetical protein